MEAKREKTGQRRRGAEREETNVAVVKGGRREAEAECCRIGGRDGKRSGERSGKCSGRGSHLRGDERRRRRHRHRRHLTSIQGRRRAIAEYGGGGREGGKRRWDEA